MQECVAVLIELYKKNATVLCVGSDLLYEWAKFNDIHPRTQSGDDYAGIPC